METAACAPCPALPAPVTLLPRPAPQAQPDGSFVYREADALKFQEYYDGLGEECPLVPTRNSVKDKGKEALITVVPPIGITARPHAKQTARRPHDRKRLTLLGREALQRSSPTLPDLGDVGRPVEPQLEATEVAGEAVVGGSDLVQKLERKDAGAVSVGVAVDEMHAGRDHLPQDPRVHIVKS